MNVPALESALRALGVDGTVTPFGAVAIVHVSPDDRVLERPETRRAAIAAAMEHGFRSLALEVAG